MSVSDAFVISKHVDSVYLVVDAEKTSRAQLINALDELQQANINVGGLLVNKAKNVEQYYSGSYARKARPDMDGVKFAY